MKTASEKQEARTAETYRGSVNVMSGAGWRRKHDVTTQDFLIENKTTEKQSYSVKKTEMETLTKRAILEDRTPLLQVDIDGRRYVVLNEDDFLMIAGLE